MLRPEQIPDEVVEAAIKELDNPQAEEDLTRMCVQPSPLPSLHGRGLALDFVPTTDGKNATLNILTASSSPFSRERGHDPR